MSSIVTDKAAVLFALEAPQAVGLVVVVGAWSKLASSRRFFVWRLFRGLPVLLGQFPV